MSGTEKTHFLEVLLTIILVGPPKFQDLLLCLPLLIEIFVVATAANPGIEQAAK